MNAATQVVNLLREHRPNYGYKEAVLNPTNPRDRANPQEGQIINQFVRDPSLTKLVGTLSAV